MTAEPLPFPVGDDLNYPDVLEYWMSVARPFDGLLLPRDLMGGKEFIAERVSEYCGCGCGCGCGRGGGPNEGRRHGADRCATVGGAQ